MPIGPHQAGLGALMTNFHSLEFLLRACLHRMPGSRRLGLPHASSIFAHSVGDRIPASDITDFATLKELIVGYNAACSRLGVGDPIDPTLVQLRDALAHGRVAREYGSQIFSVIKFSRPSNGIVTVEFKGHMDAEWFRVHVRRVSNAFSTVKATFEALPEPSGANS